MKEKQTHHFIRVSGSLCPKWSPQCQKIRGNFSLQRPTSTTEEELPTMEERVNSDAMANQISRIVRFDFEIPSLLRLQRRRWATIAKVGRYGAPWLNGAVLEMRTRGCSA
ncbi:hypothetical protein ES288_A05G404000v1 [Gossypium darwinii]|uniref:Uncharacterized protein n=1 Tax=Gossypium darwinii TaxID=34276 RepID=A0A5D2GPT8_GOSDA|nr:hypothetical protein ES288_A05G404000v1 [Gossypium darwinii]